MNKNLIASSSILINSTSQRIWDVLTNPKEIKIYLFGTKVTSDWKKGSPISFEGNYDGHIYHDKGIIIDNQPMQLIKYSYWSSFSGLEDKAENYAIVSYKLEEKKNNVYRFTWRQQGFTSEKCKCHTEQELITMLKKIKKIAEE